MIHILLTLNAIICVALVILILLQRSDPSSGGMFGGAGGGNAPVVRNPLARPTAILATLFLVFSLLLALLNKGGGHHDSIMVEGGPATVQHSEAPAGALPEASSTTLPAPMPLPAPAPSPASPTMP